MDPEGSNDVHNLRTLCNACNGGLQKMAPMPEQLRRMMEVVRRASAKDQRELLAWLKQKFEAGEADR